VLARAVLYLLCQPASNPSKESNMNKSEQREVSRTLAHLSAGLIAPDRAAATLATLHRSAARKVTQRELTLIMDREALTQYLVTQNGCLVPRC
jgi:hypothetical protein